MLNEYIIYNKQFEVLICRICKAGVIGVHRRFARTHQVEIPLKDRQEIDEYVRDLTLRSIEHVFTPTREIKSIEGIEIVPGSGIDSVVPRSCSCLGTAGHVVSSP